MNQVAIVTAASSLHGRSETSLPLISFLRVEVEACAKNEYPCACEAPRRDLHSDTWWMFTNEMGLLFDSAI